VRRGRFGEVEQDLPFSIIVESDVACGAV